jgi:hypothetical protein
MEFIILSDIDMVNFGYVYFGLLAQRLFLLLQEADGLSMATFNLTKIPWETFHYHPDDIFN